MGMAQDHADWHTLARSEGTPEYRCPWDCIDPPWCEEEEVPLVKCGRCGAYHAGVAGVRRCYGVA
jgi:hypothetical protein